MDFSYLLLLQNIRESCGGIFNSLMMNITSLGTQLPTWLVLAGIYWCVDKRSGQMMALNVSVACTLNQFTKNVFRIERPWVRDSRVQPIQAALSGAGGYSFPSGHTTRATAVWGALGASVWKQGQKALAAVCWAVVLGVAFSRNYLGVHTASDVLAALLAGIVIVLLLEKAVCWAEGEKNRDVILLAAGFLVCFLPMLKVGCLTNAGAGMGFLAGWVLERHLVGFELPVSRQEKCVRFAVGGAGIAFITAVLPALLGMVMEAKYAGFFSMFALGIFIMAVYPFFFCRKERYRAGVAVLALILAGILLFSIWRTGQQSAEPLETEQTESTETEPEAAPETGQAESPEAEQVEASEEEAELLVIAHRGYCGEFPENTLSAFAGAVDIGADGIELDVQMTEDGEIVVFHDDSLLRVTGQEGSIADYTLTQLQQLDAGSWYDPAYGGERIPTLEEALELVRDSGCRIYLELKDIGEAEGFEEAVLAVTESCGVTDRCMFASFRYGYLEHLKEINGSLVTLYNTASGAPSLVERFPADYYGLSVETVTSGLVNAVHSAGRRAFVWTVNTPEQMKNVRAMGADGIVTNEPGLALVLRHPEYEYLTEHYENSFAMPGLYGADIPDKCGDMIVQGFTKAGNTLVVTAYSKSGEYDSILYLMDLKGKLQQIVDLRFKAHTGGTAYDEEHDLLWVTGPAGKVYAISWSDVMGDRYQGEIQVEFDAELVNHNGSKVASFLTLFEGQLYVGSYVDGAPGVLKQYDIADVYSPRQSTVMTIPERIQGITFKRDTLNNKCYMLLSQGYQTEDSHLLRFVYEEERTEYSEPFESYVLPEGAEQIQMTTGGMYILFESAVRPYRATARIPNDQLWLVRE